MREIGLPAREARLRRFFAEAIWAVMPLLAPGLDLAKTGVALT